MNSIQRNWQLQRQRAHKPNRHTNRHTPTDTHTSSSVCYNCRKNFYLFYYWPFWPNHEPSMDWLEFGSNISSYLCWFRAISDWNWWGYLKLGLTVVVIIFAIWFFLQCLVWFCPFSFRGAIVINFEICLVNWWQITTTDRAYPVVDFRASSFFSQFRYSTIYCSGSLVKSKFKIALMGKLFGKNCILK